jgi:hypothetical protein
MAGKIIKTLTIEGQLDDFEILEGVPDFGEDREMIPITTLSDANKMKAGHPLKKLQPVTFKVADLGTRPVTTDTPVVVSIAATDEAGEPLCDAREYMAAVTDVEPETISVEGNRVPAYSVTITPSGDPVPEEEPEP